MFRKALALALLIAAQAWGAIAFDASSGAANTGSTSTTWSHTCTGTNLVLLVSVWGQGPSLSETVTYNGVSVPLLGVKQGVAGGDMATALYMLLAPATGAHNVVVTGGFAAGAAVSYTGVVSGLFSTSALLVGTNTSPSVSVTTTTDGSQIVAAFSCGCGTITSAANTLRVTNAYWPAYVFGAARPTAGSYSFTGSRTSAANLTSIVTAILSPTGGATGAVRHRVVNR
jgi:hypothetical protein